MLFLFTLFYFADHVISSKGKLLKQAYAYESVLITGLWQDSQRN